MEKDERIKFEKDKIAYVQHSESFRHLNSQMWQVPIIAMTLTGGLWFGVFTSNMTDIFAGWLLVFAGLCDLFFIPILWRVRHIMSLLINKLNTFNPDYAIKPANSAEGNCLVKRDKLVVGLFTIMLFIASCISFSVATYRFWPWLFS